MSEPRFDAGVNPFFYVTELSTTVLPRLEDDVSPAGMTESLTTEPRFVAYVTTLG